VEASVRQRAEKELLTAVAEHDANALRMLGRRVFETVDPDAADLEEGRRLERRKPQQRGRPSCTCSTTGKAHSPTTRCGGCPTARSGSTGGGEGPPPRRCP
jgi:hypothetical protein